MLRLFLPVVIEALAKDQCALVVSITALARFMALALLVWRRWRWRCGVGGRVESIHGSIRCRQHR
jgi:hypothetical protein